MTTIDRADDLRCDAFADALSAHLEGELDPASSARVEAHAARCAGCGALLADLRRIAADAAALPVLEPSRDLWDGIAARIEAPVVAISPDARLPRARRRERWFPAAAAAALVVVTAGVTYLVTRATLQPAAPTSVAAAPARPAAERQDDPTARIAALVEGQAQVVQRDSMERIARGDGPPVAKPRPGAPPERRSGATLVSRRADAAASTVDSLYGREISRLRAIISQRGATLDPATVAVIEQNLGIIDSAIVRSRAALRRDPASGFLNEQLTSALEKKVELLRTVATLPARSS
ncbi:MAG TPA: zf-HC2 domain-containing protein [Gemmatimonadaceae bacterium]|nr:zf-HC2 domain-containing protein [Gemmatimonadaceae bacterium]